MKRRAGVLPGVVLLAGLVSACGDDDPVQPTQELNAPEGLTVSALGPTAVRVSFSAVAGADGYLIQRAEGPSGGAFGTVGTPATTSHDDTGVQAETQYRYRVAAVRGSEQGAFSGEAIVTTPAEGPRFATIDQNITADRTLYADTLYQLSGFIKVANGATLTIEPGTTIVGDYDIPGSSLFILRGSRIIAEGTPEAPIVFTSERPEGQRQPGDWGGLIIIGNGIVNRGAPTYIEGTGTGPENPLQDYSGGTDNDDDSGILRYVRIEFAGFPTAPNEELNSLTMAAVGRGTTIEYVQVLLGLDDSFEWFGGAVDGRYLVSYESADDHFDMSEGYVGRLQNVIAFQSIRPEPRPNLAGGAATDPQGIENDGCWAENCAAGDNSRSNSQPYTIPVVANFTLVGAPQGAWETPSGNMGMMLRRGVGGLYVNGVVARYSRAAISFRGQATMDRWNEGTMDFRNILVAEVPSVFQDGDPDHANLDNRQFAVAVNDVDIEVSDLGLENLFTAIPLNTSTATADDFDWTPAPGSPLLAGGLEDFGGLSAPLRTAAQGAVAGTTYRGAVDPNGPKWWVGWTHYARF